jgi:hypothetical protein
MRKKDCSTHKEFQGSLSEVKGGKRDMTSKKCRVKMKEKELLTVLVTRHFTLIIFH